MWEIATIVEVLERKGLCTKHDLYDIITELRRENPRARIPETAFPEPYLLPRDREHEHRRHLGVAQPAQVDLASVAPPA